MLRNWGQLNRMNKRHRENYCPPRYDACGVVWCMLRRFRGTCCLHRRIHHPFIRDSILLWNFVVFLPGCLSTLASRQQTFQLLLWETEVTHQNLFSWNVLCDRRTDFLLCCLLLFFLPFPEVLPSNLWRDICYPYLNNLLFSVILCLKMYYYRFFPHRVWYARTNIIGSRTSFVIASVRSSVHWNIFFTWYSHHIFRGGGPRWNSGATNVLQIGRSLVRFQIVSLEFFIDVILPIALWPWCRLSL
jgi:hypothetical protein